MEKEAMSYLVEFRARWNEMSFEEGLNTSLALLIVSFGSYSAVGMCFLYTDLYGRPKWMLKYKTQQSKNQPVNKKNLEKLLNQLKVNFLVAAVPYAVLHYVLHKLRGSDLTSRRPGVLEFLTHLGVCIIMTEIVSYYSHRLLHTSYLYKNIHKLHHEWTAPIGLGAAYAHPVEFAFGDILILATGPLLVGSCQVTTFFWFALGSTVTVIHHSGYHLPLLPSPEFHDYHHLKFVGNYGTLGILDRLHNTLHPQFLNSEQYKRHNIIFSSAQMK